MSGGRRGIVGSYRARTYHLRTSATNRSRAVLAPICAHGLRCGTEPDAARYPSRPALRSANWSPMRERRAAEEFLEQWLANGPQPKRVLVELAQGVGIAPRTLERAKHDRGILHDRSTFSGEYVWRLP